MTAEHTRDAEDSPKTAEQAHSDRLRALVGKHEDEFEPGYLEDLREDWDD
ncbi:hypothetical protein [Sinomonas sp. G460-2]